MSVAEPFTALGAGNGFPFCLPNSIPGGRIAFLQGLSLVEAMELYWNVEYMKFEASVDISWHYPHPSSTNPGGSDTFTVEQVVSFIPELGEMKPKDRACNFNNRFAAFNEETGDPRTNTALYFRPYNNSGGTVYSFVEDSPGSFSLPGEDVFSSFTSTTSYAAVEIRETEFGNVICHIGSKWRSSNSIINEIVGTFNGEFYNGHTFPCYVIGWDSSLMSANRIEVLSFSVNYFRFYPVFYTYP